MLELSVHAAPDIVESKKNHIINTLHSIDFSKYMSLPNISKLHLISFIIIKEYDRTGK